MADKNQQKNITTKYKGYKIQWTGGKARNDGVLTWGIIDKY
jgi:hypothetical protein